MGQFSWLTSDTEEQVFCDDPKDTVYVPIPREFQDLIGTDCLVESNYDGYGRFGGRDIYALVAIWNKGVDKYTNPDGSLMPDNEIRGDGIAIACYEDDNFKLKYPIKITSEKIEYERALPSKPDPNQGWHCEELECNYCGNRFSQEEGYYEGSSCPDCRRGELFYE